MLRRLGVRGKILATLAVPIFVLALTAGWITWQSLQENRSAEQTAALMESLELQDAAGSAVAAERATNIAASLGIPGAKKALVKAQETTDQVLDQRDEALEVLDISALPTNVQDAVNRTLRDRTVLDELQRKVISGQLTEARATEQYTALSENALDVPRSVAQSGTDAGLTRHINAYTALDEAMLANTLERPIAGGVLAAVAAGQSPGADLNGRMVTALQSTDSLRTEAQEQLDQIPGTFELPAYEDDLSQLRLQLRYLNLSGLDQEAASQWNDISQGWVEATQPVRNDVRDATVAYSNDLADDARTALGQSGLDTTTSRAFDDDVPEGSVVTTVPAPGDRVRTDGSVELVVSRGVQMLTVPRDLVGAGRRDATSALEDAGFTVGSPTRAYDDEAPSGEVLDVSVEEGSRQRHDTVVTLTVSDGPAPVQVPQEVGKEKAAAVADLEGLGLVVEIGDPAYSEDVPKGHVLSQDPEQGATAHRTDTVTLTISQGPPLVEVPDVVGRRSDAARKALEKAGFQVEENTYLGGLLDTVRFQDTTGRAPKGSTVTLTVW